MIAAAIGCNPVARTILERLPALALPDCWLVSGAVFQTVWNVQTGRPPDYGIADYDIFYFDDDLSWDAEDAAIRYAEAAFADLPARIELRNQARVHLWYRAKFGADYPPLKSACDGVDRFLMYNAQIALRLAGTTLDLYALHGLGDIAGMIVRPNRVANFQAERFLEKARRWQSLWPEITVHPP